MHAVLTLLVGIHSIIGVELLVSLLLVDGLTEYGVLVDDVHWLLLYLLPSLRRHLGLDVYYRFKITFP